MDHLARGVPSLPSLRAASLPGALALLLAVAAAVPARDPGPSPGRADSPGAVPSVPGGLLRSGPMVGPAGAREATLWVQTTGPARVEFDHWRRGRPGTRARTGPVTTRTEDAHVAAVVVGGLEPGRRYAYRLLLDGEPVELPHPAAFRTLPAPDPEADPPAVTFAVGSCAYVNDPSFDRGGRPYGGGYRIFRAIHRERPDAMLWMGDNVYLRGGEWASREGVLARYAHTRALPQLRPLLASAHHYAVLDDHDFGPDDADATFSNRGATLEAFRLFWPNPGYGADGQPGTAASFRWADAEFFLLDNRSHRSPPDRPAEQREMLGDRQLRWLLDGLAASDAAFRVVAAGGPFLSPAPSRESYAAFPAERSRLLDGIESAGIEGVLFLSGNRHMTELSRLDREEAYPLYDFTISPLTSRPFEEGARIPNPLRVPGTAVTVRNFALLRVDGPRGDRRLTVTVRDADGAELWTRTLAAAELR